MKLPAVVLAVLALATVPALAAGLERITVTDPTGPPLEGGVWYPSDAPAFPQQLGPFEQTVAINGPLSGRRLPLIVMSHGTGGSFDNHYDTALTLAEAGFVVAAVTHTGDNFRDQSEFGRLESRPRHIKALIDYMLGSWPHHDALDRSRIGVFGFSAGGFTALVAIGGTPDITRVPAFCAVHPDDWACRMLKQRNVSLAAPPPPLQPDWVHDPRIAAAVIAAPAVGYAFPTEGLSAVKVPMMLWRPDADEILPHPDYAQTVYDRLAVKPEYRVVANAGHFVFLTPCPPALAAAAPAICKDPAGFDRTSFHHTFNTAVVEFFKANLPAR